MNIGFFINPHAGYGSLENRKGSDDIGYIDVGRSTSVARGAAFLRGIKDLNVHFVVPKGVMGSATLDQSGVSDYEITYSPKSPSSREDTMNFIRSLASNPPDLVIFCGGDGTVRDILSSDPDEIPVLGVPSGIKMESSVFAVSVQHAVNVLREICSHGIVKTRKADVVDIPEEKLNEPYPSPILYGEVITPVSEGIVSSPKLDFFGGDVDGIIDYFIEHMDRETRYIIGPGSTCKSIVKRFGGQTGLLGFDLLYEGKISESDITEERIFEVASGGHCKLVISPIGGQNFLLGRGNRQISGRIIEILGFSNIMIVSSEEKLIYTKRLYMDLDNVPREKVPEYVMVLTGYGMFKMVRIEG